MAIERAGVLYPISGVVDSTGANIQQLTATAPSSNLTTTVIQATHTQDNTEFTYEPFVTRTTTGIATTMQALGWGLRLTEDMTPTDDTNCNAYLPAGTISMSMEATLTKTSTGVDAGGTQRPNFRAALFRYDPVTNTGTLIGSGSDNTNTWSTVTGIGDAGTYKITTFNISIGTDVEFAQGEILVVQYGLNTGTLTNPATGTNTYDLILRTLSPNTKITFAAGQGIRQLCTFVSNTVGVGTTTKDPFSIDISRTSVGTGTPTSSKQSIISRTFNVIGTGTVTSTKDIAITRNVEGTGTVVEDGQNASTIQLPINELPNGGGGGGDTFIRPTYVFDD